jgi:allantoin racemase
MTRIRWQSFVDRSVGASYLDALQLYLNDAASPGTSFEVVEVSPPDRGFSRLSELRCAVSAVANAMQAEEDGCDAFVFGHFQEPGLYEARSACRIPVIGLGEASLLWASTIGTRIGLISIANVYTAVHEEQAARYGIGDRLHGVRALNVGVEEFSAAFHGDAGARGELHTAFAKEAGVLVDGGADVIVVAGGLYGLLLADERTPSVQGVPVVNCTPVGVAWAEMAVRLQAMTGVVASQSPAFALAPAVARNDFLELLRHEPDG